ncbi:MAG: hypothetical protein ABIH52_00415, partial [Candidatus Aenigmatarchaeota archaeon]
MADILSILVDFLCQDNTRNTCQQFIQQYPDMMNQLFFFFFFPTVLIILFVTVVADAVTSRLGVKFKVLLGIAIYMFIILSGWYAAFLWISELWFIVIIVILGVWVFFKKLIKGGGGGGQGGGLPGPGGLGIKSSMGRKVMNMIKHDEDDIQKEIADRITSLRGIVNQIRHSNSSEEIGNLVREYWKIKLQAEESIKNFKKMLFSV